MSSLNNHLRISAVRYPLPRWRYFLLFQSWAQLTSWIVTISLTMLLISGVINFFGNPEFAMGGILVGAAIGSLASVLLVVPAEFDVISNPERSVMLLRDQLESMGYVPVSAGNKLITYRPKLPRFLRWEEGNISIRKYEDKVTVAGGVVVLKNIRRFY